MKATLTTSIALLFLSTALVFGGSDTGADFLKIPIGARAVGLGQAYTALAHDVESLNWNPAGIARIPTRGSATFSHQNLFDGMDLNHVSVAFHLGDPSRARTLGLKRPTLGLTVARLGLPDQEGRDSNRQRTGSFGASDLMIGAALAFNFRSFQMGSQLKLIRQELAGERAQGFAVDLGLISKTPIKRLSLGASARNLGPKMKFIEEEFDLPLTLSLGAGYHLLNPITVSADVHFRPHQDEVIYALGTEFIPVGNISLRAGYLARLVENVTNNQESETNRGSFGGLNGFTGGLGLRLGDITLDYAITPFGELGNTHTFTFSTRIGPSYKERAYETPPTQTPQNSQPKGDDRTIVIFGNGEENTWWE